MARSGTRTARPVRSPRSPVKGELFDPGPALPGMTAFRSSERTRHPALRGERSRGLAAPEGPRRRKRRRPPPRRRCEEDSPVRAAGRQSAPGRSFRGRARTKRSPSDLGAPEPAASDGVQSIRPMRRSRRNGRRPGRSPWRGWYSIPGCPPPGSRRPARRNPGLDPAPPARGRGPEAAPQSRLIGPQRGLRRP